MKMLLLACGLILSSCKSIEVTDQFNIEDKNDISNIITENCKFIKSCDFIKASEFYEQKQADKIKKMITDHLRSKDPETLNKELLNNLFGTEDITSIDSKTVLGKILNFSMSSNPKASDALSKCTYTLLHIYKKDETTALGIIEIYYKSGTAENIGYETVAVIKENEKWVIKLKPDFVKIAISIISLL